MSPTTALVVAAVVAVLAAGGLASYVAARKLVALVNGTRKAVADARAVLERRSKEQEAALKAIAGALQGQSTHIAVLANTLDTELERRGQEQHAELKAIGSAVQEQSGTVAALAGTLESALERRTTTLGTQVANVVEGVRKQSKHIAALAGRLDTRIEGLGQTFESQQARVVPSLDEAGSLRRLKVVMGVGMDLQVNRSGTDDAFDVYRIRKKGTTLSFARVEVPYYHYYTADRQLHLLGDWNQPFGDIANAVLKTGTTHLLHDRLFTLWQGVKGVAASSAPIVEVGAWKGGSSRFLAEACRHFSKQGRIYSCDTFTGPVQVTPGVDGDRTAAQFEDLYDDARALLASYPDVEVVKGDIEDTASLIPDTPLAMLHVDVNVYRATAFTLETFAPRIEPGGVIVADDYGSITCPGVKQSVDEFVAANPHFRLIHLLTGQAVLVRIDAARPN